MALFAVVRTPDGTVWLLSSTQVVRIETVTAYEFYYRYLKVINVPLDQVPTCPQDVLEWYANKIRAWGGVAVV